MRTPAFTPRTPQLDNDQSVPDELTGRLYHANENAGDVVAGLSLAQRANLAMFCYHKSHLRRAGLAIAATCDRPSLIQAWGTRLGQAIYDQARELVAPPASPPAIAFARISASKQRKTSYATDDSARWILESQRAKH